MNRFRFLLIAVCTLALASVASAATPTATPSAGGFCNKLCIIGYHCVPNANGGVCKPDHGVAESPEIDATPSIDSTDSGALIAGSFCNKLCAYGFHCVPNANGGVCKPDHALAEPDSSDSTDLIAGGSFCNKLCAVGFHCVANANGGVCKPDHALAEPDSSDSTEAATVIGGFCSAGASGGVLVASNTPRQCGACTIFCAYPLHLVQKHNCDCVCVGNGG
jgi:hypothetical protein